MTSSRSSSGDESGSCASAAPAAIQTPIQSARAARRMSRSSSLSWISAFPPFLARPAAPRALAVVEDLAHRMVSGDAAHTAAAVRCGTRLVEPFDRGAVVRVAGCRAHVEQLLERQLAVEDVSADQPVLLLHLVRP